MKVLAVFVIALLAIAPDSEAMVIRQVRPYELEENVAGNSNSRPKTRCQEQPLVTVDYQNIKNVGRFVGTRGNSGLYNCSLITTERSAPGPRSTLIYHHLQKIDGNTLSVTKISTGTQADFKVIFETVGSSGSALCLANCDETQYDYKNVLCMGRTADDFHQTDKFLSKNQIRATLDLHTNCPYA